MGNCGKIQLSTDYTLGKYFRSYRFFVQKNPEFKIV